MAVAPVAVPPPSTDRAASPEPDVVVSVLELERTRGRSSEEAAQIFGDLNLDHVVALATRGREAFDLIPFFRQPLASAEGIRYRQEVGRDLEHAEIRAAVDAFARSMEEVHRCLDRARRYHHPAQRSAEFVQGAVVYVGAVRTLAADLRRLPVRSRALGALGDHLGQYVASPAFRTLAADAEAAERGLEAVAFGLTVRGPRVTVVPFDREPDYSQDVARTFERFRHGDSKRFRFRRVETGELNTVEERIVDRLVALTPGPFRALREFEARYAAFIDPTVGRFEREVQFYLAYLDRIAPLARAGLPFCYPAIEEETKGMALRGIFDLALAERLAGTPAAVVANDVELAGAERIVVVTGPNQGGKTTLARAVGQVHYLARLGLPVPGREVRLPRCDRVFTLFERAERPEDLRSKLQDELVRIAGILRAATSASVLVLNESFASTSPADARFLGTKILERMIALDLLAVYVTFVDELSRLGPATVSMVGEVAPDDPSTRTFRILRGPANGRAYAVAIAEKFGLTYAQLRARRSP